jgi:hypothetical protein
MRKSPRSHWHRLSNDKVAIAVSVCGSPEVNRRINVKNSGRVQQPEFKLFAETASNELKIDQRGTFKTQIQPSLNGSQIYYVYSITLSEKGHSVKP